MEKTQIIFRADGNNTIGLGHVVRCLALAQMLKHDFGCTFAIQQPSEALRNQIKEVCAEIILLPGVTPENEKFSTELQPHLTGNEIVVLDGYHFGTDYQQVIKASGCSLVCIDDLAEIHFVADVLINQAGGVKPENYKTNPETEFCLGPAFALLRAPFFRQNSTVFSEKPSRHLFLNMGGADPENETAKILENILETPEVEEIHVVVGSAYKFLPELEKTVSENEKIRLHSNLNAAEMGSVMRKCDLAVCPPSSVSYEYCSLGGLLFLKQTAANQAGIKAFLLEENLAYDFEREFFPVLHTDFEQKFRQIKERQKAVFDGKSPERLRKVFKKLDLKMNLTFRKAASEDMLLCFGWANDPETRANSFNQNEIPLEDHERWFAAKIQDESSAFYIAEFKGKAAGQIRFDGGNTEKLISYLVAPEMRGSGLGNLILRKGIELLRRENKAVKKISGYVKETNLASCRIFEKAGFTVSASGNPADRGSLKFELEVSSL